MRTFVEHPEDDKYWRQAIKAKISGHPIPRSVWDDLLGNYQAVVDAPSCYFAIELAEAYPKAKVIILNRDSEKWYNSFANTVQKMIRQRESLETLEWILRPCLPTQVSAIIGIGNLLSRSGVGLGSYDKEECLAFFHKYYADCRARIDPERCIDFKVQDGWSPLCKHLGVCVPGHLTPDGWVQAPFPQVNDTESFHTWVAELQHSMLKQTWVSLALHGLALLVIVLLFLRGTWFTTIYSYT
ncbi:hypothetical protein O1611_g3114 [Lasiodiplodia mahajangana]|uniref:Uncharacterized protein n=1 Tax=Lasiodiplodia mahajangana TaxID=1108764 RepID=A0ACC2JSQ1_9PEZI|nr:hypothetical protein O1611_g3114 [Lasiodiplodia mahajangana]